MVRIRGATFPLDPLPLFIFDGIHEILVVTRKIGTENRTYIFFIFITFLLNNIITGDLEPSIVFDNVIFEYRHFRHFNFILQFGSSYQRGGTDTPPDETQNQWLVTFLEALKILLTSRDFNLETR